MLRNLQPSLWHAQIVLRGELAQALSTTSSSFGFGSHASDNDAEVYSPRREIGLLTPRNFCGEHFKIPSLAGPGKGEGKAIERQTQVVDEESSRLERTACFRL